MNEFLAGQVASEREYEENRQLMDRVRRDMSVSRIFCLFGNIAAFLVSIASTFLWSVNTRVEIMVELGATELTEKAFPLLSLLLLYAPAMAGLQIATELTHRRLYPRISAYTSMAFLALILANFFVQFQYASQDIPFSLYLAAEMIFSFVNISALGRMQMLSTREGYPDFNFAVSHAMSGEQDRYVRMREEWLKKDKKLDYHDKNEQPIQDIVTDNSENSHEMDGVSVNSQKQDEWFFISKNSEADDKVEYEPDSVCADPSYLPSDDFYDIPEKEDIRRKPL